MSKPRRVLPVLGGGAAAALASFALPMALGHADPIFQTCDGTGFCLVQPDDLAAWHYEGVRPLITDWQGTQPYTVEDNGTPLGSYEITAKDDWTSIYSSHDYTYGAFTPSGGGSAADLGGFSDESGAQIYDTSLYGGVDQYIAMDNVTQHGHVLDYDIIKLGDFTNTMVVDPVDNTSADYIQSGTSAPEFLYNALFHGGFVPVPPEYLIPNDAFAAPDFDPSEFVTAGASTGGGLLGDLSSIASLFGL